MAIKNRKITSGLIFHSDRDVQYANKNFTNTLGSYKSVIRSRSRKGDCWDNVVTAIFFKSLKTDPRALLELAKQLIYGNKLITKE